MVNTHSKRIIVREKCSRLLVVCLSTSWASPCPIEPHCPNTDNATWSAYSILMFGFIPYHTVSYHTMPYHTYSFLMLDFLFTIGTVLPVFGVWCLHVDSNWSLLLLEAWTYLLRHLFASTSVYKTVSSTYFAHNCFAKNWVCLIQVSSTFPFVFVFTFWLVRQCRLITLINCLKGYKSWLIFHKLNCFHWSLDDSNWSLLLLEA